jgi:hypothetical protein
MYAIIYILLSLLTISNILGFYKKMPLQKYSNYKLFKTCFPDDEENKKKINYKMLFNNCNYIDDDDKPLYTLIWYDCKKCAQLLKDMEDLNLKKIYINGGYYFYDISNSEGDFNDPLLYKDDVLIGDNIFDIYSEIYTKN